MASLSLLSPASSQDTVRMPERIQAMPHGLPYSIACGYACAEPYGRPPSFSLRGGFLSAANQCTGAGAPGKHADHFLRTTCTATHVLFFLAPEPGIRTCCGEQTERKKHPAPSSGTTRNPAGSHTQGGNARPVHSYPANVTRYPPRIPRRRTDSRTGR